MATPYRSLDVNITGQVVAVGQRKLFGYEIGNAASSARYVKIYDKATAPTASDTPVMTILLPPNGNAEMPPLVEMLNFVNGMGIRGTQGVADNDNTAPTTGDIVATFLIR